MTTAAGILEFLDAPASASFELAPEEALAFFGAKGLRTGFDWRDVFAEEHVRSFTVAKMMDTDLLADVHASLLDATANGVPFRQWADSITPLLQARGWWGRKAMTDPLTGQTIIAQLGSPGRLQTIYRTNMQMAYATGAWEQIEAQKESAPFLLYDAVDDSRTREQHAAWDGLVLPIDDKFWTAHYPPNGWNCRCGVVQLSEDDLADLGLEVSTSPKDETYTWTNPRTGKTVQVPRGVDPGFNYHHGRERLKELAKLAIEKAGALPPQIAPAAVQGINAAEAAALASLDAEVKAAQLALAKAIGADELKRATTKAAERAAQWQLDNALATKAPYLSKAIKDVLGLKSAAKMAPSEIIAAAQAKAAKSKASAGLAQWKQSFLADKPPSASAQAAFDALPGEAQEAILEQMSAAKAAAKAKAAAEAQLAKIEAGELGKLEAQTLAKMKAAGTLPPDPVQAVQAVQQSAASAKAAISKATTLAGLKKSLAAGKTPTPAQAALLNELDETAKADLFAQVDAAKAKAKPSAPETGPAAAVAVERYADATPLNPDRLTQTGPQGGSNLGGEFTDLDTGVRWYVKYPDAEDALRNEALANALYRLAGVEVPEVRLIQFRGRTAIASRIVDGLRIDRNALTSGRVAGVQDHFTVDAWLANWNVIGPDYANTKLAGGRGMRLDPGGALRYRAQGGMKGAAFGDQVLELESMRSAGTNSHAASVFRHATDADMLDGARRVLAIPDAKIREAVEEFGPLDRGERDKLLATLLARREDLAKRFPDARPRSQAPAPVPTARVTEFEQREIEASRANGYTLTTDGGDIEDHHVVAMTYTRADGKRGTRLALKLRPEAAARLQVGMPGASGENVLADFTAAKARGLVLLRGINTLAAKGDLIRADKEVPRLEAFKVALAKLHAGLEGKHAMLKERAKALAALQSLDQLAADLDAYFLRHPAGTRAAPLPIFDFGSIMDAAVAKERAGAAGGIDWKRRDGMRYSRAGIRSGHVIEDGVDLHVVGVRYSFDAELPSGARVAFIPDVESNALAARGYMQIDVEGVGADVTSRALAELERMGISAKRTTEQQRLELYIDRHLYLRSVRDPGLRARWEGLGRMTSDAERVAAKLAMLNSEAGFDVRTSKNWDPEGRRQAFGHGRPYQYRADLQEADAAAFNAGHVLFHNPVNLGWDGGSGVLERFKMLVNAGGQLASQMDRIRRGVALTGSSVPSDFASGGASYVFTRLSSKSGNIRSHGAGFILRAELSQRLDAFSYDGDVFGDVAPNIQSSRRAVALDGMRRNARNLGNETNFRDTVSLFDAVEFIVLDSQAQVREAIQYMRARGYSTWPDGRPLEEVIIPASASPYRK